MSTGTAVKRIAGLHPAAGGPEAALSGELCSGDLLLEALVACAGVTLKAVATALSLGLIDGEVVAEGDLDFRGTLGVDREAPVGFKEIRYVVKISRSLYKKLVFGRIPKIALIAKWKFEILLHQLHPESESESC